MHKLSIISLAISSFIFSANSFAIGCEVGAETQGEVIACEYDTNFTPLEAKIKSEYELLLQELESSANVSSEAVAALVAAQKSWVEYRENTCEFTWLKSGGMTAAWGVKYSCQMDFSNARLKALQRYRKELAAS